LRGDGLKVERDLLFWDHFYAEEPVWLRNVDVAGSIQFTDSHFSRGPIRGAPGPLPEALNLRCAKVGAGVYLTSSIVEGAVLLDGAEINGLLDCESGSFCGWADGDHRDNAIFADAVRVIGDMRLRKVKAFGSIVLRGAVIGGSLDCEGANVANIVDPAINAEVIRTAGDVLLRGEFTSLGGVNLRGATIGGNLDCDGAVLNGEGAALKGEGVALNGVKSDHNALTAASIKVEGSVLMRPMRGVDFSAKGPVTLKAAQY
jgi:hypothetical protein